MKRLSIVILNWNGRRFLERFLPSLTQSLPDYAEVVIADNASTDDSIDFLATHYPGIRVLRNERNEGFSRGYNLAMEQVNSEYFCLLNSDIEVTDHWIEPIIEMMDANETIAVVQPKIRSFAQPEMFEYAGASGGFIDKYGYPFCRGRVFSTLEKDNGQYDESIDIFWATGAAMFVRRDVYRTMGGLDEDFFAHMEEIDFCWRIKNAGFKIKVCPASVVLHVGGGTLPKNNSFKTFLNFRNNLFLLLKNLPENRLTKTLILRFFLDQVAALFFLLQLHIKDFCAVYKAMFAFAKNFKKCKAKRNTMPKLAFTDVYDGSVVFLNYFKGKHHFNGTNFF